MASESIAHSGSRNNCWVPFGRIGVLYPIVPKGWNGAGLLGHETMKDTFSLYMYPGFTRYARGILAFFHQQHVFIMRVINGLCHESYQN